MTLAVRTCPVCGDVRTLRARSDKPVIRQCRSCSSRSRTWLHREFTPAELERGRQTREERRAQVDSFVVDLLVAGCPERATVAERVAAIQRMPGLSAAELARKLGVTERSIQRYRAELRAKS